MTAGEARVNRSVANAHETIDPTWDRFNNQGYAFIRGLIDQAHLRDITGHTVGPSSPGTRVFDSTPAFGRLAQLDAVREAAQWALRRKPRLVRSVLFNKCGSTNWLVPWHQDLTIAVHDRVDTPGFQSWSSKAGVPHVQPPVQVLENMVAIRVHIDDADGENGALRVLPGSHLKGRLHAEDIEVYRGSHQEVLCEALAGDVLIMRPLLLHASSKSSVERSRRVLHIEYSSIDLPPPLRWRDYASCDG